MIPQLHLKARRTPGPVVYSSLMHAPNTDIQLQCVTHTKCLYLHDHALPIWDILPFPFLQSMTVTTCLP